MKRCSCDVLGQNVRFILSKNIHSNNHLMLTVKNPNEEGIICKNTHLYNTANNRTSKLFLPLALLLPHCCPCASTASQLRPARCIGLSCLVVPRTRTTPSRLDSIEEISAELLCDAVVCCKVVVGPCSLRFLINVNCISLAALSKY